MVRTFIASIAGISLLFAGAAAAASNETSTYAGLEQRGMKALSEQQVDDLRSGRGMGLALAAELNHYPGPVHVLEASGALGLSAEQLQRTEALLGAMRAEAIPIGQSIIKLEAELEARFASGAAESSEVERLVMRIAEAQGGLRYVHLSYHLQMRELLTPQQLVRYDELRGYTDPGAGAHRHH
jgi:Spy/CpxP family protein refolding chaperone